MLGTVGLGLELTASWAMNGSVHGWWFMGAKVLTGWGEGQVGLLTDPGSLAEDI